jgi:putative zinc finger/helix-turn-helix YgiT family protein
MGTPNSCLVCESGSVKLTKQPYRTKYDGKVVCLPSVELFRCSDCQEEFFSPDQARALSLKVKNAVRESLGLLPPEKITEIREKSNLTQTQLEYLLDTGPKVVTRWENGRVIQPKTTDTVLRLLDRKPQILKTLKLIAEQREQARSKHTKPEHFVEAEA